MEIRAAMVEYTLARRGYHVRLLGDADLVVARARPYRANMREGGTLYLASGGRAVAKPPANAGFAILRLDDTVHTEPSNRSATVSDNDDEQALVIEAYDAMRELDAWDLSLKEALLGGVKIDEFLSLGRDLLACPLAYFDRNLIVLATSDDYWATTALDDVTDSSFHIEGQLPANRATDLVEDDDYLHAAEIHGGFYYRRVSGHISYGINTFDQGEYLARLVMSLPEGQQRLHRGQEQLADCFHALLDDLHLRYAGNAGIVSSQNDSLHTLVKQALLNDGLGLQLSQEETAAILASYDWMEDDDLLIVKLVFFEGLHWGTISLYLCGLFERAMAGSCAFPDDRQIIWFVNLASATHSGETRKQSRQRFMDTLVSILRNYACKAGISDGFSDFSNARDAYKQAELALEVGQARDPHYWYFSFRDYALDYLLAKCGEDLAPTQVCHPAFEALMQHDERHGTEYAKTLACFLRNSQNTTNSANELFIHRTSFMRRMSQMEKIASFNLNDPDEVLYLLLSAKLLRL